MLDVPLFQLVILVGITVFVLPIPSFSFSHIDRRQLMSHSSANYREREEDKFVQYFPEKEFAAIDSFFLPTDEELERGYVLQAPRSWGSQVFRQEQMRWMTLGGSNTVKENSYADMLEDLIQSGDWWPADVPRFEKVSANPGIRQINFTSSNPPTTLSYVLNEGVSASGPFVMHYRFENWSPHLWPNVISMEYMVNCFGVNWNCMSQLDNVIQYINAKYFKHGLDAPSYVFIELTRAEDLYVWQNTKLVYEQRASYCNGSNELLPALNPNVSWFTPPVTAPVPFQDRGAANGPMMMEFARFYRYPVLSARDAFYPTFVRHVAMHSVCEAWPLAPDGIHLSTIGARLLVEHIVKPFIFDIIRNQHRFSKYSKPPTKSKAEALYLHWMNELLSKKESYHYVNPVFNNLDIRFFPMENYKSVSIVSIYQTWGHFIGYQEHLDRVVLSQNGFSEQILHGHERDSSHHCLGAYARNATITFDATIPEKFTKSILAVDKEKMKFSIVVGYLHSWNSTYVGDVECRFFARNDSDPQFIGEPLLSIPPVVIHGNTHNKLSVKDSTSRDSLAGTVYGTNPRVLQCHPLTSQRLSCFTKLAIHFLENS